MDRYIVNHHGLKIHTIENLFEGDEVFLLCHGFTGSVQSHVIAQVRSFLNQQQLSSVSIDFTNNINDSDGDFSQHTVSGEVEDLEVVYEQVIQRYKKVYLVGHSMGCTVSLQFSLKREVEGLVLIAPPYSMKDIIDTIAKTNDQDGTAALEKWRAEGTTQFYKESMKTFYSLDYGFYQDLKKLDLGRYLTLQVPSVIIYSLADPVVPPVDSKRLFEELGAEKKRLLPIPDAPHSFNNGKSTEALVEQFSESLQFLREEL